MTWARFHLVILWLTFDLVSSSPDLHEVVLYGTERQLSGTDRIATLRTRGDFLRYSLLATGEECVLKKFVTTRPVHRCEDIPRQVCQDEYVLLRKVVVEDCSEQEEFCEAFHRMQKLSHEIVVCEPEFELACNQSQVGEGAAAEVCHPRRIAFCRSKPQRVTLTERKQRCLARPGQEFQTTKLCITYEDGTGQCKSFPAEVDPSLRNCDQIEEMKVINSEVSSSPRLDCHEKMAEEDYCHPSHCRVVTNKTRCVADNIPKRVQLKEVVCEKCVPGRRKLRPVIETRSVCRDKVEHICVDTQDEDVRWRKWCRSREGNSLEASRASSASYQIEVAPGLWLSTKNRTEAAFYLRQQATLESHYELEEDKKSPRSISQDEARHHLGTNERETGNNKVSIERVTTNAPQSHEDLISDIDDPLGISSPLTTTTSISSSRTIPGSSAPVAHHGAEKLVEADDKEGASNEQVEMERRVEAYKSRFSRCLRDPRNCRLSLGRRKR